MLFNPSFSTLFSVGYLVLEFLSAGTGVSVIWYWSFSLLVLVFQSFSTGVSVF